MKPHFEDAHLTVHVGDCREVMASMPEQSVHCVVTSPPYWGLRDYGHGDQLGLEPTPQEYVANMVAVFREVRRVLRDDGTVWLNLGDSYIAGQGGRQSSVGDATVKMTPARGTTSLKPKDLVGIPWRVAFALQADGWYLRSDIIWAKPNPMPESVTDRPTKAHEYVFLLSKSARYYYDADAVREPHVIGSGGRQRAAMRGEIAPRLAVAAGSAQSGSTIDSAPYNPSGRNLRSVWQIATQPYPGAHFATFPEALVEPCVKAGTSERGVCPECGAPWVREVELERVPHAQPPGRGGRQTLVPQDDPLARAHNPPASESSIFRTGLVPRTTTTGWRPGCAHVAEPVPAVVLDPFAGSGTTGRVANRLGRRAILIDLSAEYIDQAMARNAQAPLGLGA